MRILIATGGSAHSGLAVEFGAILATQLNQPPTILSVAKQESDLPQTESIAQLTAAMVSQRIANTQAKIRVGNPAEEILVEAETGEYHLIVIGDRQQHRWMTRFLLSTTAKRVVEHAHCPVIIAKGHIQPLRHVLLCDSGIDDLPLLDRFSEQIKDLLSVIESVTVLHVMSQISGGPGVEGTQLIADAQTLIEQQAPEGKFLSRDLQRLTQSNVVTQVKVRHGLVVDEILRETAENDYSLVVIGANRDEGWRKILLDDLAKQIIFNLKTPVMVVR